MDWTSLIPVLLGVLSIVCTISGWFIRILWEGHTEMNRKFADLPNQYARRDDVKDMSMALFAKLDRIEEKLDRKADK